MNDFYYLQKYLQFIYQSKAQMTVGAGTGNKQMKMVIKIKESLL